MKVSTVNISFNKDLLELIDQVAEAESRSRSELIREAARMYIERKNRWEKIFSYGEEKAAESKLTEEDILNEVKEVRREKKRKRAKDSN